MLIECIFYVNRKFNWLVIARYSLKDSLLTTRTLCIILVGYT